MSVYYWVFHITSGSGNNYPREILFNERGYLLDIFGGSYNSTRLIVGMQVFIYKCLTIEVCFEMEHDSDEINFPNK